MLCWQDCAAPISWCLCKDALAEVGAAFALGKKIVAVAPNAARFHNADVGRQLSRSAVIDASALPESDLVSAIMTPLAA
jgi:hypothetical protein